MLKFFLIIFSIALLIRAFFSLFGMSMAKMFARQVHKKMEDEILRNQGFSSDYKTRPQQNAYTQNPTSNNRVEDIDFEEVK